MYTDKSVNSAESDATGQFESAVNLATGLNQLTIAAFSENEKSGQRIDVIYDNYSSEVKGEKSNKDEAPGQEKKEENTPQNNAPGAEKKEEQTQTQPEQYVQQPQQEVKKETQAPAQAIVGNVSQVTETSVVVEEKKSKNNVETTVNKETLIINQESKSIKLNTLQKNDVAAIILKEKTNASAKTAPTPVSYITTTAQTTFTEAEKIYVNQNSQPSLPKRHAIEGVITSITGEKITIVHQTQTDRLFDFFVNSDTVVKIRDSIVKVSSLAVGQRIAVVGELTQDGALLAKLIHIIKNTTLATSPTPLTSLTPTKIPTTSPSLSVTPSSIPTPTSINLTPTITETQTLTEIPIPTPTTAPCELTGASWITNENPVTENTSVQLNVTKTGNCDGRQVTFEVKENDSLIEGGLDDPAITQPLTVVFPSSSEEVQGTWVAEWQNDCAGLCNPPEYYFNASLDNANTVRSADPLLIVDPIIQPTPVPTLTETPIICTGVAQIWASEVVEADQGLLEDGSPIETQDPNRVNPALALGPADGPGQGTFFSLGRQLEGKRAMLTVSFPQAVVNQDGPDIAIYEVTWNRFTYYTEEATVEVSADGQSWKLLGVANNKDNESGISYFDIVASDLTEVRYVRLTDKSDYSPPVPQTSLRDGFDVDAVSTIERVCAPQLLPTQP